MGVGGRSGETEAGCRAPEAPLGGGSPSGATGSSRGDRSCHCSTRVRARRAIERGLYIATCASSPSPRCVRCTDVASWVTDAGAASGVVQRRSSAALGDASRSRGRADPAEAEATPRHSTMRRGGTLIHSGSTSVRSTYRDGTRRKVIATRRARGRRGFEMREGLTAAPLRDPQTNEPGARAPA